MKRELKRTHRVEIAEISQKELVVEKTKGISEITQQLEELAKGEVLEADGEIDVQLSEIEQRYQDCVKNAGLEDVEELQKLEKTVTPLRLKVNSLRRIFKKMVPFLLPLVLTAKIEHADMQSSDTSFNNRTVAAEQLRTNGITDEQKSAYIPGVSDILYRGITPVGYANAWELMKEVPENLISGRDTVTVTRGSGLDKETEIIRKQDLPEREDAWRLYLGIPQENNTFSISEYKPAQSKNNKYYHSINNWFEKFSKTLSKKEKTDLSSVKQIIELCKSKEHIEKELPILKQRLAEIDNEFAEVRAEESKLDEKILLNKYNTESVDGMSDEEYKQWNEYKENDPDTKVLQVRKTALLAEEKKLGKQESDFLSTMNIYDLGKNSFSTIDEVMANGEATWGAMGHFKISLGEDEKGSYFSYYDVWNLEGSSVEGEEGLLGKPFEIYDRIYYNPGTYEVIKT